MNQRFFLMLALACLIASIKSYGQVNPRTALSSDTFRIQNYPLKIWLGQDRVKRLNSVQPTLFATQDPQIMRDWNTGKSLRGVGLGVQAAGLIMLGAGLLKTLKADDGSSGGSLLMGGAVLSLGGIVLQIGGTSKAKKAMRRYNSFAKGRLESGPISFPINQVAKKDSIIQQTNPHKRRAASSAQKLKVGISLGINASKIWEIGGSEALRSKDKMWWAWSKPITVFVEKPSVSGRSAMVFDLQHVSKGFRIKTEVTNASISTKVRSDFQMRFLKLTFLKKRYFAISDLKLKASGQAGLFAGYAHDMRLKTRSWSKDEDEKNYLRKIQKLEFGDEPRKINSKRLDLGATLGCGIAYPFGPGYLAFDTRFSVGFLNLEKSDAPSQDLKLPSLHTRDVAFLLTYAVPVR